MSSHWTPKFLPRRRREVGQTSMFVLMIVGIFMLALVGLAVDFGNFWFHRQSAQAAADSACTAGAMDMLVNATTGAAMGGFTVGTSFDCSSSATAAPCQYANLNGYDGKNTAPGNQVSVSFVRTSTVPGIDPLTIPALVPNSIRVDVIDHVAAFFTGLLTGRRTQDVHVRATCAVLQTQGPVPLIILKPNCPSTFQLQGSGNVSIIGGPTRSIEVNSNDPLGAMLAGSGSVNLSQGGPDFTGSGFAVVGGPNLAPGGFIPGTTGHWVYPAVPVADPFAHVVPPIPPASAIPSKTVASGVDGCPDSASCTEYFPGLYTTPIVVINSTAIFNPGLYYFNIPAGLFAKGNCGTPGGCIAKVKGSCNYALLVGPTGVVRPGTNTTCPQCDSSGGTTFYLSGSGGPGGYGSVLFDSSSGKPPLGHILSNFNIVAATCPGAKPPDPEVGLPPGGLAGNILLGPCTQDGTYFSSLTNASATGPSRGMLFFQDRADGNNDGQPSMQGGGGLLIGGSMYFHNCPNSLTTGCVASTDYNAYLQFQGNSGSGTYLLGDIVTDELATGGGGSLAMQLNSNPFNNVLKVALVQ